jgi:hypothetical protein
MRCLITAESRLPSPAYLKERGVPEHPRDLLNHACLLHKFPATGKIEHWP